MVGKLSNGPCSVSLPRVRYYGYCLQLCHHTDMYVYLITLPGYVMCYSQLSPILKSSTHNTLN